MCLLSDTLLCDVGIVNLKNFLFTYLLAVLGRCLKYRMWEGSPENTDPCGKRSRTKAECCCRVPSAAQASQNCRRGQGKGFWGSQRTPSRDFKCWERCTAADIALPGRTLNESFCDTFTTGKITRQIRRHQNKTLQVKVQRLWCMFCRVWTFLVTELCLIIVGKLIKLYTKIIGGIMWCLVQERSTSKL